MLQLNQPLLGQMLFVVDSSMFAAALCAPPVPGMSEMDLSPDYLLFLPAR